MNGVHVESWHARWACSCGGRLRRGCGRGALLGEQHQAERHQRLVVCMLVPAAGEQPVLASRQPCGKCVHLACPPGWAHLKAGGCLEWAAQPWKGQTTMGQALDT